ncbi:MAG TPA: hypothetical protein VNI34_01830 [Candidatus Nitrosotalea sp.]|nr:hypothetical protein [Candidatus Nitrosotalea sp.]
MIELRDGRASIRSGPAVTYDPRLLRPSGPTLAQRMQRLRSSRRQRRVRSLLTVALWLILLGVVGSVAFASLWASFVPVS